MIREIGSRMLVALITFYIVVGIVFIMNLIGIASLGFIYCLEAHVCGWVIIWVLSAITVLDESVRRI